jgi:homoserine kinase type II
LDECLRIIGSIPFDLPKGIIHADLFHDNALFDNGHVTGIIDWYFAGLDSYALDIAITMNDWCLNKNGEFDIAQGEAFVNKYQTIRELQNNEVRAIKPLQVQSATRFWLSRLLAQQEHLQTTDQITVKDPDAMKTLVRQLIDYTV